MRNDTLKLAVPAPATTAAPRPVGAVRPRATSFEAGGHPGKRVFDIVASILLLVGLVAVFAVIALLIKLDSPGPVFYRVRRVGYRGRPLRMLKFRKMRNDARGGPLTVDGDPRLTRIGRVLTRTRLDELPQLWDVLCGRMSLIGPRPEDPGFVALHDTEYRQILAVRPGITGLSQIAYKAEAEIVDSDSPVEDYLNRILPQKLRLDRLYARTTSPLLDLRILWWTFVTVRAAAPGLSQPRQRGDEPPSPAPSRVDAGRRGRAGVSAAGGYAGLSRYPPRGAARRPRG